jgi:hypothetical protein
MTRTDAKKLEIMSTATRRRIAILCLIINTSLLVIGAITGHPVIAATAAIGMAGGTFYLNRTAR